MNYKIRIENIVASGSLGIQVPLQKIVANIEGAEYEPEQFPGLVLRMKNPKSAALIFSSGKIVCTGTRTQKDLQKALKKLVSLVRKAGIKVPSKFQFRIENIVSSTKLDARVDLDKVAFELENSEYEPEQFPGLVLRMKNPNVAFLIFSSGKIVCTGARKTKDVKIAIEKLIKQLKSIKAIVKE
ncbi:MAG: TATA-box-binding protein [Candidatus Aenigmarchaeota archaeon ex4484_224]|nr:MAG: TATA-box-binding protein [Candidatus Aenigmarchaeota archaeon ex4484_224]